MVPRQKTHMALIKSLMSPRVKGKIHHIWYQKENIPCCIFSESLFIVGYNQPIILADTAVIRLQIERSDTPCLLHDNTHGLWIPNVYRWLKLQWWSSVEIYIKAKKVGWSNIHKPCKYVFKYDISVYMHIYTYIHIYIYIHTKLYVHPYINIRTDVHVKWCKE